MKRFSIKKINHHQSFGELLRRQRESLGLDLRQISFKLKIPEKYLAALEEENLIALPNGSYGRHFLIQYARFLKLPTVKLISEYDIRANFAGSRRPATRSKKITVWPLKRLVVVLLIVILLGYLGWEARRLFLPPPFIITNPPANVEIEDLTINVNGSTAPGATVQLNGANIPVGENGNFSQVVTLQPGLNTITLTARRAYSTPVNIRREVLVKSLPPEPEF